MKSPSWPFTRVLEKIRREVTWEMQKFINSPSGRGDWLNRLQGCRVQTNGVEVNRLYLKRVDADAWLQGRATWKLFLLARARRGFSRNADRRAKDPISDHARDSRKQHSRENAQVFPVLPSRAPFLLSRRKPGPIPEARARHRRHLSRWASDQPRDGLRRSTVLCDRGRHRFVPVP